MTNAQYMTLPQWPNAYPASGASATLKLLNEDRDETAAAAALR
jgi:tRNA pseudouridine13 synthase